MKSLQVLILLTSNVICNPIYSLAQVFFSLDQNHRNDIWNNIYRDTSIHFTIPNDQHLSNKPSEITTTTVENLKVGDPKFVGIKREHVAIPVSKAIKEAINKMEAKLYSIPTTHKEVTVKSKPIKNLLLTRKEMPESFESENNIQFPQTVIPFEDYPEDEGKLFDLDVIESLKSDEKSKLDSELQYENETYQVIPINKNNNTNSVPDKVKNKDSGIDKYDSIKNTGIAKDDFVNYLQLVKRQTDSNFKISKDVEFNHLLEGVTVNSEAATLPHQDNEKEITGFVEEKSVSVDEFIDYS